MDKALVWYLDSGSFRYDGKEYNESVAKLCRDNTAPDTFKAAASVNIKTK